MQPDISVVVPIYGVEKYLKQCVDSILNQTFKNMEVILVDDGSRDRCPQMVDEYAAQDARVVAIHQPNGGYGKAVNAGIARARGKYIGIIESDDWIAPDMYEKLFAQAEKTGAEITKGNFYWVTNSAKGEMFCSSPGRSWPNAAKCLRLKKSRICSWIILPCGRRCTGGIFGKAPYPFSGIGGSLLSGLAVLCRRLFGSREHYHAA